MVVDAVIERDNMCALSVDSDTGGGDVGGEDMDV
jgi:hypothetical protein